MRRSAIRPRWHALAQRGGTIALLVILLVYSASMHVGFIAKDAGGPFFIVRLGSVGAGWLEPQVSIQDIPSEAYVGLYHPTIPVMWSLLFFDDAQGTRLYVPLWIPASLLVAAKLVLWWWGRPRSLGGCPKCGYNLVGCVVTHCEHCDISTAVCPECGSRVPQVAPPAYADVTPSEHTPRPPAPTPARSPDPE